MAFVGEVCRLCLDTLRCVYTGRVQPQGHRLECVLWAITEGLFLKCQRGHDVRIVEVEQNGCTSLLPLEPSLEIMDYSPDGFNWG